MITEKPTSEGIAETLGKLDLKGRRLGLQLYPEKDHAALIDFITARGASVDTVLPYVYDARAADGTSSPRSRRWRRAASTPSR